MLVTYMEANPVSGIDVNEELNVELGDHLALHTKFDSTENTRRNSLKRRPITQYCTSRVASFPPLLQSPATQDLSPTTTSPESEVLTPPATLMNSLHGKMKGSHSRGNLISGMYPPSFLAITFNRTMVLD